MPLHIRPDIITIQGKKLGHDLYMNVVPKVNCDVGVHYIGHCTTDSMHISCNIHNQAIG